MNCGPIGLGGVGLKPEGLLLVEGWADRCGRGGSVLLLAVGTALLIRPVVAAAEVAEGSERLEGAF